MIGHLQICVFCTSCKPQNVFVLICRAGRTILGSQLVQNTQVNKEWKKMDLSRTGKSLSEVLIFVSFNPQYGNKLFTELRV